MPVPQQLLDILVCPACKSPVQLTHEKDGLLCSKCNRIYPIQDDIPVMLVDRARPASTESKT
jgi:uncharacterized protein